MLHFEKVQTIFRPGVKEKMHLQLNLTVFRPGAKFRPCLKGRGEFTPGRTFNPPMSCKHYESFNHTPM